MLCSYFPVMPYLLMGICNGNSKVGFLDFVDIVEKTKLSSEQHPHCFGYLLYKASVNSVLHPLYSFCCG